MRNLVPMDLHSFLFSDCKYSYSKTHQLSVNLGAKLNYLAKSK